MKTKQESLDALVFVEKDGADRLKIRSDQLEQIGHKLRGFSVFNSIILPLMISAATVFFAGLFQYVSWTNEVRLREATEIANRAMNVSEKVTTAINKRVHLTFLFLDPLRSLVLARDGTERSDDPLSQPDETVGAPPSHPSPNIFNTPDRQALLTTLDSRLEQSRFDAYYERLKQWNEGIGQLVTDVDYALDRPIFIQAGVTPPSDHKGIGDYWGQLEDMNCLSSLPNELEKNGVDSRRLKNRLVGIHYCFMQLHHLLAEKKNAKSSDASWDQAFHKDLSNRLDKIDYMGNEFRCYALHRVDYYNSLKERSIISPWSVGNKLMNEQKADADRHFEDAAKNCDPEKRREAARAAAAATAVASAQRPTQTLH
jgi:hypothetical protein